MFHLSSAATSSLVVFLLLAGCDDGGGSGGSVGNGDSGKVTSLAGTYRAQAADPVAHNFDFTVREDSSITGTSTWSRGSSFTLTGVVRENGEIEMLDDATVGLGVYLGGPINSNTGEAYGDYFEPLTTWTAIRQSGASSAGTYRAEAAEPVAHNFTFTVGEDGSITGTSTWPDGYSFTLTGLVRGNLVWMRDNASVRSGLYLGFINSNTGEASGDYFEARTTWSAIRQSQPIDAGSDSLPDSDCGLWMQCRILCGPFFGQESAEVHACKANCNRDYPLCYVPGAF
jgi:hypothetical protein